MAELVVAIVLLSIAVLGALAAQISHHRLTRTSFETTTAVLELQAAMDELLLLPVDSIPFPALGGFAPGAPMPDYDGRHLTDEAVVPTYPDYVAGQPVPDPLEIVLAITWTDHSGGQRQMSLASMKTR